MLPQTRRHPAFTIVELLVVIGIIGILIALLLPAVSTMRAAANKTATIGTITAIDAGLNAYRNASGEDYPPSGSDCTENDTAADRILINSPYSCDPGNPASDCNSPVPVASTGANLLVLALAGADLLGTAGFKDVGHVRGSWWDDLYNFTAGDGTPPLYALDDAGSNPTMEPLRKRLGTFIDINKTQIVTMQEYAEDVLLPRNDFANSVPVPGSMAAGGMSNNPNAYRKMRFILDSFGFPILYYKASVGARRMITDVMASPITQGVYNPLDNALYTGYVVSGNQGPNGLDLGAGTNHQIRDAIAPSPDPSVDNLSPSPSDTTFDNSFARFVWDRKVTARNEPVNKDSYLLISPGPDALWGTDDDITNFRN